jgi:DNA-binding MarR family transcriptional regulator
MDEYEEYAEHELIRQMRPHSKARGMTWAFLMTLAELYSPDEGCAVASFDELAQERRVTPQSARYYIKKLEWMRELIIERAPTPDGRHRF